MARVEPDRTVLIQPRDPLVLRDARPFSADPGARAFSLAWPLPRTVAGALRSHIVRQGTPDTNWNATAAQTAQGYVVHGPLLVGQHAPGGHWEPYVPASKDMVAMEDRTAMILRPDMNLAADAGTDLPHKDDPPLNSTDSWRKAMENVALRPMKVYKDEKPKKDVSAYWSLERTAEMLGTADSSRAGTIALAADKEGIKGLPLQERIHVRIDQETRTAAEGALFTTESREFVSDPVGSGVAQLVKRLRGTQEKSGDTAEVTPALAMIARIGGAPESTWEQPAFASIGGERRLVRVSAADQYCSWPEPMLPDDDTLKNAENLRLQLVTPAIFAHGWLPGWMADGVIPGLKGCGLGVELVGVASDRPVAVSGWRLASRPAQGKHKESPPGPKATVLAVPAGSVYFFRITKGHLTQDILRKLWLAPISDSELHANEGFGLALPGIW